MQKYQPNWLIFYLSLFFWFVNIKVCFMSCLHNNLIKMIKIDGKTKITRIPEINAPLPIKIPISLTAGIFDNNPSP